MNYIYISLSITHTQALAMPWELSPYVFNSGKQFCMIMRGSSMSKTEHNLKATMYAAYATRRKLHGFIRNKTQLPGIYLNKLVVYYDTTLSNTQQRKVYLWKYVCWVPIISRASGRVGMRHVSDRAPDLGLKIPGREVFQKSVQPYMNSYEHNMSCSIQTNTICFAHTIDCIYWNKNSNLPGTRPCYWQILILQPHQIQPWKNSMAAMGKVDICGTNYILEFHRYPLFLGTLIRQTLITDKIYWILPHPLHMAQSFRFLMTLWNQ